MNTENLIYEFYHKPIEEKQIMEMPNGLEPLHEEIWRSIQQEEANTMPKKMSREATWELMRILNEIDFDIAIASSVQMDEELKVIMEVVKQHQ